MAQDRNKGQTTMGIIRKFLGLGLAAFIGLSAMGAKVDPAYCNQNDIIGDTPIMTNAENWVSNILGDGKYDPSTDEGRTELARDVIKAFGAEDTSVKGRLAFRLSGITSNKTITVSGITANGNFTIDWGDGTREVVENPPMLAGAMPRASKSVSHKFPGGIPTPTIDFPEGDISEIRGEDSSTSFIHDEDGNSPIEAVNMSEYSQPIVYGMGAFAGSSQLKELVLGTNVVSLGAACFASCHNLRKLTALGSLGGGTSAMSVFRNCSSLGDVIIGGECRAVPDYAFNGCTALSNVTFMSNCKVVSIGTSCFSGCTSLKKLHLPEGIKSFSLGYNNAIEEIYLPDSLEDIEQLGLNNRNDYKTFKLPPNISIMSDTFYDWHNLEYITLPKSLKTIGAATFGNCYKLTNVTFEAGTRIGLIAAKNNQEPAAFEECNSLVSIEIPIDGINPSSATQIQGATFVGCDNLESVSFNYTYGKKAAVGYGLFSNCPKLSKIAFNVAYPPAAFNSGIFGTIPTGCKISIPYGSRDNYSQCYNWSAYADKYQERDPGNSKIVVKCGVTSSSSSTSPTSPKLGRIFCPETFLVDWGDGNVDEYESGTSPTHTYNYVNDTSLRGMKPRKLVIRIIGDIRQIDGNRHLDTGAMDYSFISRIIKKSSHSSQENPYYVNSVPITDFEMLRPDDGNFIFGDSCFIKSKMKDFSIGKFVTSVGRNCFWGSTELTNMVIHPKSYMDEIGAGAFASNAFVSISIPKEITEIKSGTFEGCDKLEYVTFLSDNTLESIGDYAFTSPTVNGYGTVTGWKCLIRELNLPKSLERIGSYSFGGCQNLEKIGFAKDGTLKQLGRRAFYDSTGLKEAILPISIETLGDNVFHGCVNVTNAGFDVNSEITDIGYGTFSKTGISSFIFPKNVTVVPGNTFSSCGNIVEMEFPEGIVEVGKQTFFSCGKLEKIVLPSTLERIPGYFCAEGCDNLTTVECKAVVPPEKLNYDNIFGYDTPPNLKIYVPTESVDAYKAASGWSVYSDIIYGKDF